jgi:cysteine desulfurase/selenocysteine lyase
MSINTTSTSDRAVADASEAGKVSDAPAYENLSSLASLPDVTMIAKLANEFFAASPGAIVPVDLSFVPKLPTGVDSYPAPEDAPEAAPYPASAAGAPQNPFPAPGFSGSGNLPTAPSASGTSASSQSPSVGILTEADFRAVAASLASSLPIAPPFPPAAPGSSSNFLDGEKGGPWASAPVFPPASEMHSFPGVPAFPSSPPTAPPSGADLFAIPASPAPGNIPLPAQGAPPTVASSVASSDPEAAGPWSQPPSFPASET